MSTRSYPIPGEVLDSGEFFGLSYDQLLIIGFLPVIVMMFSFVVGFIPIWVSLLLGVVTAGAVGVVVAKSPKGQDPFEWAGAAFKRHLSPKEYTLQPDSGKRSNPVVLDVVHTADDIGEYSPDVAEKKQQQSSEFDTDTNTSTSIVSTNNN